MKMVQCTTQLTIASRTLENMVEGKWKIWRKKGILKLLFLYFSTQLTN